ncbi:MAG TPA: CAP domain-containing protein [Longimicrobium sp.]
MGTRLGSALLAALCLVPNACTGWNTRVLAADLMGREAPVLAGEHARGGHVGSFPAEVARLVNARRRSVGCPPLEWDPGAAAAAQAHADDMARRGYFSHVSPEGRTPIDRLRERGVRFRAVAENIAVGQTTPEQVVGAWLNSPGHRGNIENCRYSRAGVGFRDHRWAEVLLRP